MKKILFVINTMGRAGAEMALLELLRRLKTEQTEISLYVLTGQGEMIRELPEGIRLLNSTYDRCSVHTTEGKRHLMKTVLKSMFRRGTVFRLLPYLVKQAGTMICQKRILPDKLLWRVLSDGAERFEESFDLAVAYIEGGSTYYVADHVKAKKKVAFFHVDYKMAGYTRALDKECYLNYDKVFTVSDEVRNSFLDAYPECQGKTEVFHNLLGRERIINLAEKEDGFADGYTGYRLLTVGRLTEQKDFAQSIRAMKLLKEKGIRARWYILGEGDQRPELEKMIRELDLEEDFYLLGTVENPYCYMRQADVYVHATKFEGKSIAIQEAKILGCPVLVSDCNGNREQVQHGIDGLLCDMTPEAICEGIQKLLSEEGMRKQFGEQAAASMMEENNDMEKLLSLL